MAENPINHKKYGITLEKLLELRTFTLMIIFISICVYRHVFDFKKIHGLV